MIVRTERVNRKRLFFTANLAMFMIGFGFAVRANIAGIFSGIYSTMWILRIQPIWWGNHCALTFTGFALTLLFGSALVDLVGVRRVLAFSAFGFIGGSGWSCSASFLHVGYDHLSARAVGLLLTGSAGVLWRPPQPDGRRHLSDQKTHRINLFHAWWPAGIVVGGLLGLGFLLCT